MHRTYTVDVKEHLLEGTNTLRILLESPIKKGVELYDALDYKIPHQPTTKPKQAKFQVENASMSLREKPPTITAGTGDPDLSHLESGDLLRLVSWDDFRISDMVLNQEPNGDIARILAHLEIESTIENANALLQLKLDDDVIASTKVV